MTHPPQEVLIKVMCSERLPESRGIYLVNIDNKTTTSFVFFDGGHFKTGSIRYAVTHWYEPATRIVLTEEEYMEMSIKANRYDQSQQAMKNT